MKNYIQPGKTVSVITPVGGMVSGKGYVIGKLFGVASLTTAEGVKNELVTEGVFEFPGGGDLFETAFFSNTEKEVGDTSATGLYDIGVIVGAGTDTAQVRLNGTAVKAVA